MVTAMPGSLRTVLELAYVRRRDYREAAAELGVSEDEARRRVRLGLQLLSTAAARTAAEAGPGSEKAS
jgi:RNA polymerase sigma-70 factor (ECF subfamily)